MNEEIKDTTLELPTTFENNEPLDEAPRVVEVAVPIEIVTIGELLRSKREAKGLYLKSISQQTKIHMGLLENLEKNELSKLPSKTYVRGFVKSAAKILGINQEVALNALEATYNREDAKIIKKEIPNHEMRNETARNTLTSMVATPLEAVKSVTAFPVAFIAKIVVGLIIVGVIGLNIKNLADRAAEEHLKLPQVFSTIHQKVKSSAKILASKAAPKPVTSELVPPPAPPIKINLIHDKKDTTQKPEITVNEVSLKNISIGEKQFTEDNSITGEKLEEIFSSRYRVKVIKGVENVFINAVDGDSWITYKVDDKEIKKYVLRQGRSVFFRGKKIRLFIGNTKSLKIFYNNKLIALNSKSSVKNLVFPEELKTKFMSPLFVFQKDGTVVTSEEYVKTGQTEKASTATEVKPTPVALPETTKKP